MFDRYMNEVCGILLSIFEGAQTVRSLISLIVFLQTYLQAACDLPVDRTSLIGGDCQYFLCDCDRSPVHKISVDE